MTPKHRRMCADQTQRPFLRNDSRSMLQEVVAATPPTLSLSLYLTLQCPLLGGDQVGNQCGPSKHCASELYPSFELTFSAV